MAVETDLARCGGPDVETRARQERKRFVTSRLEFVDELPAADARLKEFHASQYLKVLTNRRWLLGGGLLLAFLVAALVTLVSRVQYRAAAVMNVEREATPPIDVGNATERDTNDPQFIATEMRLMENRAVAERAVARLGGPPKGHSATDEALKVLQSVDVTPVRGTNLVELSVIAPTAARAAQVANAFAESYIDWKLAVKSHAVDQTSEFLTQQIAETRKSLDTKEQQLLAYGKKKGILTDPRGNVDIQSLEALNQGMTNALADRFASEAKLHEAQASSTRSLTAANPLVAQLQSDLARMERDYAQRQAIYKPDFPAMVQLKEQIESTRKHLASVMKETAAASRDSARAEWQAAVRREESLKTALANQRSQALAETADLAQYNALKSEVDTQRALLEALMKRSAETEVLARMQGERISNVRIVESALPPARPFKPSYPKNAAAALAFGLLLGLGFAAAAEYMDRSLRTREDVAQVLKLPVLAAIPRSRTFAAHRNATVQDLVLARNAPDGQRLDEVPYELTPWAAAYRAFRTSLLLSRGDAARVVAITSALPVEGKTSTAVNLAVVLAQLGKRILLVDCDLHKPRLHEIFGLPIENGVSNVLTHGSDPGSAIYETRVPGLYAMPAGPPVEDPSALLHTEGLARVLEHAREDFDHVVLDTPPVLSVPDAVLLGREADGVVLCMRGGGAPREQVVRARDELLGSGARILGVVIIGSADETVPKGAAYEGYRGYRGRDVAAGAAGS
jgi:capsular exopolysaccharide synthesis family protein